MSFTPAVLAPVTLYPVSAAADPTGAKNAAQIMAAVNAVPAAGGAVNLAAGTWTIAAGQVVIPRSAVYLTGAGQWATLVNGVGTGAVIRMYDPTNIATRTIQGGGVLGLTINIAAMGNGSSGVHIGDIYKLRLDVGVIGAATSGASSKNIWFDNNYYFTEGMEGTLFSQNGPVVFDTSVNTSGFATGSFDRPKLTVTVQNGGVSDGVVWQGAALMVDGELGIYGNFAPGASQFAVIRLAGTATLSDLTLNVGVELDGTGGTTPITIFLTGAGNTIYRCRGLMDFAGSQTFTGCNNPNQVAYFGSVRGDVISPLSGTGWFSGQTATNNGTLFAFPFGTVLVQNGGASFTGLIASAGVVSEQEWIVRNAGAGTLTWAVPGTSRMARGTSDVIAANSQARYSWDVTTSLWYRTGTT